MTRPPKSPPIRRARPDRGGTPSQARPLIAQGSRPVRAVLFDVYGTLVDWERGLGEALAGLLETGEPRRSEPHRLFEQWECIQFGLIAGAYRPYREIIEQTTRVLLANLGVTASPESIAALAGGIHRWPLFPDLSGALDRLLRRYRVGLVANMDDDLLRGTLVKINRMLGPIVSAERVRAYKPHSLLPFETALADLALAPEQVVHAAVDYRYDLIPARELGMRTVRVARRPEAPPPGVDHGYEVSGLDELCELLKV